jgi:hypothetical protein
MKTEHKEAIIQVLKNEIGSNESFLKDLKDKQEIKAWKRTNKLYKEIIIELIKNFDVKPHLIDGIKSLREKKPDIKQAEHNFFEIAEHLGIKINCNEKVMDCVWDI